MRLRPAIVVLVAASALGPTIARADAEEASLHVHGTGGVARVGDPLADGTDVAPLVGLGARFTYATSDYFAYEARLSLAQTGMTRYAGVTYESDEGELERATRLARLTAGVTARLGARFIPTLHLSAGAQARQLVSGRIVDQGGVGLASIPDASAINFVVSGAVGFDYRVNRRLVLGASAGATHAFGGPAYDAVQGAAHLAYYWYPRWL